MAAAAAVLAAAATAAYAGTFSVPFFFDDGTSIAGNPTLLHFASALVPPPDATVSGRPVLNLSLALNYALGGTSVAGYHALNLAVHVLAGLTLFGILRRTLRRLRNPGWPWVAFAAALLWSVHPLLTGSVTYVIQRAESLMALFYLLTLYCHIRGSESEAGASRLWHTLSVAACLLGMGTKESMASAPLIVLLYDRTFLAGSFRDAWARRRGVFAALFATLALLLALVVSTHGRAHTVGFGSGVAWWRYSLTQLVGIVRYLRLSLWPSALVFDYGTGLEAPTLRMLPCALLVAGLVAATLWALVRRPALGFLGAVFFSVLAPSSSILPVVTETLAEHRMYLPLAPLVILAVIALQRLLRGAALPACLGLAAALLLATQARNETYRDEATLWRDSVAKFPENERAHYNLACVLEKDPGTLGEAIGQYQEAVRLRPDYEMAQGNLASALQSGGRTSEAIPHFEEAIRLKPGRAETHNNLGNALMGEGRVSEAVAQFSEALRLRPSYVEARNGLGCALEKVPGRGNDAVAEFREAVRIDPAFYQAHFNLGNTLKGLGRNDEAVAEYREASRLRPDDATIRFFLAGALLQVPGGVDEAVAELKEVVRLRPGDARALSVLSQIAAARP